MEVLHPAHRNHGASKGNSGMAKAQATPHRVDFALNAASFELLRRMTEHLGLNSAEETVTEALRLLNAVVDQARDGYSAVIVEDPSTLKQRKLKFDTLQRVKRA